MLACSNELYKDPVIEHSQIILRFATVVQEVEESFSNRKVASSMRALMSRKVLYKCCALTILVDIRGTHHQAMAMFVCLLG